MNKIIFVIVAIIGFASCKEDKSIYIEEFTSQDVLPKIHEGTISIYFLVSGYSDHEYDYELIEDHVCKLNRDSLDNLYRQFWVTYFRKSKYTNNDNIRDNPKDFFNYSTMEDKIVKYTFIADSLVLRHKYYLKEYPKESKHFKEYDLCK